MLKNRTAILYFAFSPEAEAERKPLFKRYGKSINQRFYQELQDQVFDTVTPFGLPLIHCDEAQQQGEDFAERISDAVERVWEQGFERVIIIGNDCPEIEQETIQQALGLLETGNSCLVKTQHGGAGLIALHRHHYHGDHWRELEWRTERTFDELFDCLADCRVLEVQLNELNTLADAYVYCELHRGELNLVALAIDRILNPLRHFVSLQAGSAEPSGKTKLRRRGPPFQC